MGSDTNSVKMLLNCRTQAGVRELVAVGERATHLVSYVFALSSKEQSFPLVDALEREKSFLFRGQESNYSSNTTAVSMTCIKERCMVLW